MKVGLTSPQMMSSSITTEEYERVMKQNSELSFELQNALNDVEYARKAYRDFAAWTYNQRCILMRDIANIRKAIEERVKTEIERGDAIWEQELNSLRKAAGLCQLSQEDMMDKIGMRRPVNRATAHNSQTTTYEHFGGFVVQRATSTEGNKCSSPPDVGGYGTITDQVEALIEDEKRRC